MARIVVFDSGLGSLSIIFTIQRTCKCEIIYFADHKNFPYGKKTKNQLEKIISESLMHLDSMFHPDIIVIASNTPSIMLNLNSKRILQVKPPLKKATSLSKTKHVGILGTNSMIKSKGLSNFIKQQNFQQSVFFHKINSSQLVNLVESGEFLKDKNNCRKVILKNLNKILTQKKIDVCTISSTHITFLKPDLEFLFPKIQFIDPSDSIALTICNKFKKSKKNSLKIYTSQNTKDFADNLKKLKIKNKINTIHF